MWTALLLMGLGASEPVKLASVGFQQLNLSDTSATFFTEHFAQQLAAQPGLQVTSQADIANVLGLERQKQLLGCSDASQSCMAELAGALGVDGIVTGQLAKVGNAYLVNVKIIATDGQRSLFLFSTKVLNEEAVADALNLAARQAARALPLVLRGTTAVTAEVDAAAPSSSGGSRLGPVALLVGGGAVALAGVPFVADAIARYGQLDHAGVNGGKSTDGIVLSPTDAAGLRDVGQRSQTIGWTMVGVGAAAAAGGALWMMLGGPPVHATVWTDGKASGLVVGGALP